MSSGPNARRAEAGLPDRWLYCPKVGNLIINTFLPFKTPLCDLYDRFIADPNLRFHPDDVLTHSELKGKKIGLWIDLTKTDRYYDYKEVQKAGCKYKKMQLAGHGSSPTKEECQEFITAVQEFLDKNPNGIIGIHCTHGFNRTGFLIASYLCEITDWDVGSAVQEFAKNRHGGIYKQEYVDDLKERYGFDEDDPIVAPPKPVWENGISSVDLDASTSDDMNSSRDLNSNRKTKLFMDGLYTDVDHIHDQLKAEVLRARVRDLCGYNRNEHFPGLQPVSLSRENLPFLHREPYLVSWKADGMRYMIYIFGKNEVFAFDRDNEAFQFRHLTFLGDDGGPLTDTLVDAEMIIDKVKLDNGSIIDRPRLLLFDVIAFKGECVMQLDFNKRLDIILKGIINPRDKAIKEGKIEGRQQPSVRRKDFWPTTTVHKLFEKEFKQHIGHEIDGLVFQPVHKPYITGRCDIVLKWKPPSHNSIDFRVRVEKIVKEGLIPEWKALMYVNDRGQEILFAEIPATKTLKENSGKILEFTCDIKLYGNQKIPNWKFLRVRTDKSEPNALNTASNVLETMMNPVTKDDLCRFLLKRVHPDKLELYHQHQDMKRQKTEQAKYNYS